ncbi:MAG TPA: cyclopropane-fatty-acyl-phospholipid synthase family protein, partial [Anaerolineae bacterium]
MARTIMAATGADAARSDVGAFINLLFPPPRNFNIRLWDGTTLDDNAAGSKFTLVFRSPGAARKLFSIPVELAMAESYIRGDFDIEGDMVGAFRLFEAFGDHPWKPEYLLRLLRLRNALPVDQTQTTITRGPLALSGAQHSKDRDRAAVQYHYDVGNDFYALWLDKRMVYSCAYFKTSHEDIDTAQEQKLDLICRKLRLNAGEYLLDIGCGWGGLLMYAAEHYGVMALGVTLSTRQAELAKQRIDAANLADKVSVRLLDYRDLEDEQFDKLVSVGMFEHVGRSHLPEYFSHAQRLLKPGGLFLNHGIAVNPYAVRPGHVQLWERFANRYVLGTGQFSQRYIFPDGELEPVSDVNMQAECAGFEVLDVENLREHYALTLRQWVARLEAHHTDAVRLVDETIYRTWKLY